jgi:hypothetical protein
LAGEGDSERLDEGERFFPAEAVERPSSEDIKDLEDFAILLVSFEDLVFRKMLEEAGRAEGSVDC